MCTCIRNTSECLTFSAATMLILTCQPCSSFVLIAAARKNKKWKSFVRLHHGKPVSDQHTRTNEMVLMMGLFRTSRAYMSHRWAGTAENWLEMHSCPQEAFWKLLRLVWAGADPGWSSPSSGQHLAQGPLEPLCMGQFNCWDAFQPLESNGRGIKQEL